MSSLAAGGAKKTESGIQGPKGTPTGSPGSRYQHAKTWDLSSRHELATISSKLTYTVKSTKDTIYGYHIVYLVLTQQAGANINAHPGTVHREP